MKITIKRVLLSFFVAVTRAIFLCFLLSGITGIANIPKVLALNAANTPANGVIGQQTSWKIR